MDLGNWLIWVTEIDWGNWFDHQKVLIDQLNQSIKITNQIKLKKLKKINWSIGIWNWIKGNE